MQISKRVAFGTIIIMIALILIWGGLRYYGGEKMSVGGYESIFYSRDFKANDTTVIFIRNDDAPIIVYVTDYYNKKKAVRDEPFKCLDSHELESYERKDIEFTVPDDGEYGLLVVTTSDLDRATFRIQVREPIKYGHIRYSVYIPIVLLAIIVIVSLGYSLSSSSLEPRS